MFGKSFMESPTFRLWEEDQGWERLWSRVDQGKVFRCVPGCLRGVLLQEQQRQPGLLDRLAHLGLKGRQPHAAAVPGCAAAKADEDTQDQAGDEPQLAQVESDHGGAAG